MLCCLRQTKRTWIAPGHSTDFWKVKIGTDLWFITTVPRSWCMRVAKAGRGSLWLQGTIQQDPSTHSAIALALYLQLLFLVFSSTRHLFSSKKLLFCADNWVSFINNMEKKSCWDFHAIGTKMRFFYFLFFCCLPHAKVSLEVREQASHCG